MENQIVSNNEKHILKDNVVDLVINTENKIKELKEVQEEYKKIILEAMKENNIIKLFDETTGLTITLVEAKDHLEKFNQSKFREENPDMYDDYVEFNGKKNAYLIIKSK